MSKITGDGPAMPIKENQSTYLGLTIEQEFSYGFMKSMLKNTYIYDGNIEGNASEENLRYIAQDAIKAARILIAELNKEP